MKDLPLARLLACLLILLMPLGLAAEDEAGDDARAHELTEIVVTATRTQRAAIDTPNTLHVLDSHSLRSELQARTIPETLECDASRARLR